MYKNYIFDLYGTLIDIHTDEAKRPLWDQMRQMYSVYGADYTPEQIRDAFHYLCKSEALKIKNTRHIEDPEVDYINVFIRLLLEAPTIHESEYMPVAWSQEDVKRWAFHTGVIFRILSRDYYHVFEDTVETLQALKKKGCRLFVVTNAQRIFTMPEIEQVGIAQFFDDIIISSDYGIKKPDPQLLDQIFQKYHIRKSRTVYVGNAIANGLQMAMDYGLDTIFLNSLHFDAKERKDKLKQLKPSKNAEMPKVITSGKISELLKQ